MNAFIISKSRSLGIGLEPKYTYIFIKRAISDPQLAQLSPLLEAQRCEKSTDRNIKQVEWRITHMVEFDRFVKTPES